ncbi:LEAF RUST 10 DISEASE-RESISTANCE LOCUS RECEPTOR-LIKE PROTEIN KINASE-like 2.1 isoform X2 [Salvia divinorum]|uniref:LEAF RUST 10 DISEASE-RESISTANCE LOCUS RECEPTOR-LIKE PROTEIN KINASE-like 2.1 isoform X2 n=1 Tax=Salvia divinorum TaxID=28513 RepID=A0ABD1FJG8_SALDI
MITTHNFIFLASSSLLILSLFHAAADAKSCSPSACGAIRNISSPFRLKTDPSHCGRPKHELTCENNVTLLYLNSIKYYVKHIDYQDETIRLVDASINNDDICSFPTRSSHPGDFTDRYSSPYYFSDPFRELSVNLISCPNPMNSSSSFTDITQHCASNLSHPRFSYVHVGRIMASKVPHLCGVDLNVMISGRGLMRRKNVSLSEIHQSLLYGFEPNFCYDCGVQITIWEQLLFRLEYNLFLIIPLAILAFVIAGVSLPVTIIVGTSTSLVLLSFGPRWEWIQGYYYYEALGERTSIPFMVFHFVFPAFISSIIVWTPRIVFCPLVVWFLIYKFRRRHFGLAKLCSTNKETVTLTAARGTIGYVAPELINRSFGAVSYKADVYSFGMLLMEMVNLNTDLTRNNDESSKYFPNWIYDHLNQGRKIHLGNVDENVDGKIGLKMTIVALWCIQMCPDNRPSMNKVLEMLEGDVEHLQIPDYPGYMAGNEEESCAIIVA